MSRPRWHHPFVKYTGVTAIGIVMVLSLFFIKVKWESRQEFIRAESARQDGRIREAVEHYERAIMWYTPFSSDVRRSISQLWVIGDQAEANQDTSLALYAYRSLRASLYSTRSFYQPHEDWITKSEARIVKLMAIKKAGPNAAPTEIEKYRVRYARMHQRNLDPPLIGTLLTELGFLGWIGTTLGLIWYGMSPQGRWLWRPCVLWGSGIIVFSPHGS
ncbi:hypothetical protein C2W62_19640 [Candidatus Entotheonella serta]|nr:hypothetical protein C2W62_19640 [Candidatus Entotheonella serta]